MGYKNQKNKTRRNNNLWNDLVLSAQESHKYREDIDKIKIYSNDQIFSKQLEQLRKIEADTKSVQYSNASQFILQANNTLKELDATLEPAIVNQVYARLIELLNMGLWSNEANPTRRALSVNEKGKTVFDRKQRDAEAAAAVAEMRKILNNLALNKTISTKALEIFEKRILKQTGNTKQYVADKADLAEALAVEILSQNKGWKTIQTGAFKNKAGEQLIEDVMSFNLSDLGKKQEGLTYTVIIDDKRQSRKASSLQDFFTDIEKLEGKYSLILDNSLYDVLQQAAILSTQVKSGQQGQPILTKAERNSISLSQSSGIGFFSDKETAYVRLNELYKAKDIQWKGNDNSKELAALANYRLSKKIAKTTIKQNQLYFTEKGFVTASEWMQSHQATIKFAQPEMGIGTKFLSEPRRYQIYKARGHVAFD